MEVLKYNGLSMLINEQQRRLIVNISENLQISYEWEQFFQSYWRSPKNQIFELNKVDLTYPDPDFEHSILEECLLLYPSY